MNYTGTRRAIPCGKGAGRIGIPLLWPSFFILNDSYLKFFLRGTLISFNIPKNKCI